MAEPANSVPARTPSPWLRLVVPLDNFLKQDIPPKEPIIDGFLYSHSLGMIYAKRGTGKTRFVASMAVSIATGRDFLKWKISKPRRVLFVDGELAAPDFQSIFRDFAGTDSVEMLDIISSESFSLETGQSLNIATHEDQDKFLKLLDALRTENRAPEVIIFDNNSSLTGGLPENDNSEQEVVLSFFTKLRHLGYTVILVHHAGKSGDQRGASRREDFLELSIKLHPKDSLDGSASFGLEIMKSRSKIPLRKFECQLVPSMGDPRKLTWAVRQRDTRKGGDDEGGQLTAVLSWIYYNKPITQAEVVQKTGISKSTISRYINTLFEKGFLEAQDLQVTEKGEKFIMGEEEE